MPTNTPTAATARFCKCCGSKLATRTGRGRPQEFCAPIKGTDKRGRVIDVHQCRDMHKALEVIGKHGQAVMRKAKLNTDTEDEHYSGMRTLFFQLANCVPWNLGLKRTA